MATPSINKLTYLNREMIYSKFTDLFPISQKCAQKHGCNSVFNKVCCTKSCPDEWNRVVSENVHNANMTSSSALSFNSPNDSVISDSSVKFEHMLSSVSELSVGWIYRRVNPENNTRTIQRLLSLAFQKNFSYNVMDRSKNTRRAAWSEEDREWKTLAEETGVAKFLSWSIFAF